MSEALELYKSTEGETCFWQDIVSCPGRPVIAHCRVHAEYRLCEDCYNQSQLRGCYCCDMERDQAAKKPPIVYRRQLGLSFFYYHEQCKPDKPDLVEVPLRDILRRTPCSGCPEYIEPIERPQDGN